MSPPKPLQDVAAIVLCGGGSLRMGFDKASLDIRGESFLQQIVNRLFEVVDHIIVVANQHDQVRLKHPNVVVVTDRNPGNGPLEGIATGLAAMPDHLGLGFVTSCDVPLINPRIVKLLAEQVDSFDAVVPVDGKRIYGLTAVYRKSSLTVMNELVESGRLKVSSLGDFINVKNIDVSVLQSVDPALDSLRNINSLADYRRLAEEEGFTIPKEMLSRLISND